MLRSLKELERYQVTATDGDIGSVTDFLFDDQHWTIRYMVTDTGGFWEGPRRVLISPISFRQADWSTRRFHLSLTQDKVKRSPNVDLDRPVSRQYERDYSQYYGWPYYWGFAETWTWGLGSYPAALEGSSITAERKHREEAQTHSDPHLRSAKEITGYHIQGSDGEIGHIDDFIVDDETWAIRYLVIDTSNWWFGSKVLVSPHWAHEISWEKNLVYLTLPKEAIRTSPPWNPEALVNREYEERLYDYYGRPRYWVRPDTEERTLDKEPADVGPPPVQTPKEKHISL